MRLSLLPRGTRHATQGPCHGGGSANHIAASIVMVKPNRVSADSAEGLGATEMLLSK